MEFIQLFQKKIIHRKEGVPYLVRWTLFGLGKDSSLFSIKLHHILVSDEECLHSHPWAFLSIILKGSYLEYTRYSDNLSKKWGQPKFSFKNDFYVQSRIFTTGNILWRPANWIHRLAVVKPVWTLVFTFRKVQKWGFFTREGFIPHHQYNEQRDC